MANDEVNGGDAMAIQRKLVRVLGLGPLVHCFLSGESSEREERMGNSPTLKETCGEATKAHGGCTTPSTAVTLRLGGYELDERVNSCCKAG